MTNEFASGLASGLAGGSSSGRGVRALIGTAGRAVARASGGPGRGAAALATAFALLSPSIALASPAGERVVYGDVTFIRQGNTLFIEASDGSIIEFDSFDIAIDEIVQFIQPHDRARVLNRILGATPTQIDGQLYANGIVYLVNPAGVIFGPDSVVNVGSIYAAAATISNEDFRQGIDRFTEAGGAVENHGAIRASKIHLLGRHVRNFGDIRADGGVVTMAAGGSFLIQEVGNNIMVRVDGKEIGGGPSHGSTAPDMNAEAGVVNEGTIRADGGQALLAAGDMYALGIYNAGEVRASGGRARLIANDGVVHNAGLVSASAYGDAGEAIVQGPSVVNTGTIEADSEAGNAGYAELTSQNHTYLVGEGRVSAEGGSGHATGGEVLVHSFNGSTYFGANATVSVAGGEQGGDAGFVEISALDAIGFHGSVDLGAAEGYQHGTLLIDPQDITIVAGNDGDGADDGEVGGADGDINFGDGGTNDFVVTAGALESINGDVILEATRDIFINTTLDLGATDLNTDAFTLTANNNITFADGVTITNFGTMTLTADADASGAGNVVFGNNVMITADAGGGSTIMATGVDISVNGAMLDAGTISLSANNNLSITGNSTLTGAVTLTADADTSGAGTLDLAAGAGNTIAFTGGVTGTGADITFGDGMVTGSAALSFTAANDLSVAGTQITATNALSLMADNNLSVSGNATLAGSTLTLTADADTSGAGTLDLTAGAGNTITLTGAADLDGQAVSIGVGDVDASAAVDIDSASTVAIGGDLAANGQIDVDGTGVTMTSGSLTTDAASGFDINVTSTGDVTITDSTLDADGALVVNADNNLSVAGDSTLAGTTGTLAADADTSGAGALDLTAGAGNTIMLMGAMDLDGQAVTVGLGDVNADSAVDLDSVTSVQIDGDLTADGQLDVDAATVTFGGGSLATTSGADLNVSSTGDLSVTNGSLDAEGTLTLMSGNDLTVTGGSLTGDTAIVLIAVNNATLLGGPTITSPSLTLTADSDTDNAGVATLDLGGATLNLAGALSVTGESILLGAGTVDAAGNITLASNAGITATGPLTLDSAMTLSINDAITASGGLTLIAVNDLTIGSVIDAGNGDLDIASDGNLTINAALNNADTMTLTADADTSGAGTLTVSTAGTLAAADRLELRAFAFALTPATLQSGAGGVLVSSTGDLDTGGLATINTTGTIELEAANDLTVSSALALTNAVDLELRAGNDVNIFAAITNATGLTVTADSDTSGAGDAIIDYGDDDLVAGGDDLIVAGEVVITGENVEVRLDNLNTGPAATVNDAALSVTAVTNLLFDTAFSVDTTGGVILSTGNNLTVTDAITGVDFITLSGDNLDIQANLAADFDITLTGVTSVMTMTGTTVVAGDELMVTGPTLTLDADHMSMGLATINGTTVSISGDVISTAGAIDIDGATSVTTVAGASINANGALDIDGGMLTLGASHLAGGNLTLNSPGAVAVTGDVQSTGGAVDVDGTAVSFANGTTLDGMTGVDVNGTTSVTLGTGIVDAGTGALSITSAADLNVTRTLTTTGAIALTSDGNVAMTQAVTPGADSLTVRADADEDGVGNATLNFAGTYNVVNAIDIAGANVTIENTNLDSVGATFRAGNDLVIGDSSSIALTLGGGNLLALAGDDATLGATLNGLGTLTFEADFAFAGGDPVINTLGGDFVGVATLSNASAINAAGAVLVRGATVAIERTSISGTAVTLESTDATLLGVGDTMFGITFNAGNGVNQTVTATGGAVTLIGDTTYTSGTGTSVLTLDGTTVALNLTELTTTSTGGAASLAVNGAATLAGDIISDAGVSFDSTLMLSAAGDQTVRAGDLLSIAGDITKASGDLTLEGDANLNGGTLVDLDGDITVTTGSLTIDGDAMLAGSLISAGNQLLLMDAVALDGAGAQTLSGASVLTASGAITKAAGNLRVTGGNAATINLLAVTVSGGDLTIDPGANAAVMLGGPVSVSGDFSSVGDTFANMDSISASTIMIDHGGSVSIGDDLIAVTLLDVAAGSVTGADLQITASNLTPIILRGDVINLSAGLLDGVANVAQVSVADGNFLTVTGGTNTGIGPGILSWAQDANLLSSNVFLGTFPSAPGAVSLTSAGGAVTLDALNGVTSATSLTVSAGTDINVDAAVSAALFDATSNTGGGGGTIFVNQNIVTAGDTLLTGPVDVAAALIDAGGDLTVTGALDFTAAGAQTARAGGTLLAMGTVDSTGDLTLAGGTLVDGDDDVTVVGGNLIVDGASDFEGDMTVGGDLTFMDAANLAGETIAATGLVTMSGVTTFDRAGAGAQTLMAGDLLAADDVTGTTTGLLTMQITGGGELELRGDTTTAGALTLDGDTLLSGVGNQLIDSTGALLATGTVTKSTAGNLAIDGATLAFMDDVALNGAGDATFTGAADFDGDVTVANGDLTVNDAVTFGGDVMAQSGVATFNASVVFDANSAFSGADPLTRAGFQYLAADSVIAAAGIARTDGGLRIDAANGAMVTGNLTVDSLIAATNATLDMVGDLMVTGTAMADDDILVTGDINAATTMAGNDINVSGTLTGGVATAANDVMASAINVSGDVTATAGSVNVTNALLADNVMAAMDVTAGTLTLTGNATAAAGDVSIGSGVVSGIVMAGNDVIATGSLDAAATTAGNDINIAGTLSGGSATAANDLDAGALDLTGSATATAGAINVTGNADVDGDINAGTTLTVAGATNLGGDATSGGAMSFDDLVFDGVGTQTLTSGAGLSVTGTTSRTTIGNVVLDATGPSTLTGAVDIDDGDLVINSAGATTFSNAVNLDAGDLDVNSASLTTFGGDVTVAGGGITADNAVTFGNGADLVQTSGSQVYGGVVTFDDATTITSTGGGMLTFNDMIAGDMSDADLAFNTTGTLAFNADVDASSITSNAGTTAINGATVSTRLGQDYANTATFGGAVTLASTSGGDISFGSVTGSGGADLALNTTGDATFGGGDVTLGSLATDAGGSTILMGDLTTNNAGGMIIMDMLALGGDTTLTANGGATVNLAGGIAGASDALVINTSGLTSLGGTAAVGSLATDAPGTVQLAVDLTVDDGFDFGEGSAVLVGDTRLIDMDADGMGTRVDEVFGGNFTLMLASANDLILVNNQGTGGGGALGSLDLQAAYNGGAASVGNGILWILADTLVANNAVMFNADGRATVPNAATVVFNVDPNDLTGAATPESVALGIDVTQTLLIDADTFTMGQAEKLTVFGNLQVGAGTGVLDRASIATLSDINTVGDMRIYANTIRVLARAGAPILASDGNPTEDPDAGLDFVTGGDFDWLSVPVVIGGGSSSVRFGSVGAMGDIRGTLSSFIQQDFGEPITALTLLGQPLVGGVPSGDVFVLDLASDGPTQTGLGSSLSGALAAFSELAEVPDDVVLDDSEIERLRQMAINAEKAELDSLESVIALYDDVSTVWLEVGEARKITVNRLNNARVREVLAEFERVIGTADGGENIRPLIAEQLDASLQAYIATKPEEARFVDPESEADIAGFTAYFLDNAPEESVTYLKGLADVLQEIRSLGLNTVELREVREELLTQVVTGDQDTAFIGAVMQAVSGQRVEGDTPPEKGEGASDDLEARTPTRPVPVAVVGSAQ